MTDNVPTAIKISQFEKKAIEKFDQIQMIKDRENSKKKTRLFF